MPGYHTPKKSRMKYNKNAFTMQNNTPKHAIQRRQSFIPIKIIQSFNNNSNLCKDSASIKKKRKRIFSGETIPEEEENKNEVNIRKSSYFGNKSDKTKKEGEINNDYFNNLTKSVFTNESHLNKNYIVKSPGKIYNSKFNNNISAKTLFNNTPRRKMSDSNSDFISPKMNYRKNTDNVNLNINKDGLTINLNYKVQGLNRKLFEKIDELLKKKNLTKEEIELVLNYYEKSKDRDNSPKHRLNNDIINSPRMSKKQNKNKNNSSKFKEKIISIENEKIEKVKTVNEQDNNKIILYEVQHDKSKFKWFNIFLCCLKTN